MLRHCLRPKPINSKFITYYLLLITYYLLLARSAITLIGWKITLAIQYIKPLI